MNLANGDAAASNCQILSVPVVIVQLVVHPEANFLLGGGPCYGLIHKLQRYENPWGLSRNSLCRAVCAAFLGQHNGTARFAKGQSAGDGCQVGNGHEIDPNRQFAAMNPWNHDGLIAVRGQIETVQGLAVVGLADDAVAEQIFEGKSDKFQDASISFGE